MNPEELQKQILVETERLAQLELDYKNAEQSHFGVVESFCRYEGGSVRQENLRDQQLREAAEREYRAKSALEAQQQLVADLKAANGQ